MFHPREGRRVIGQDIHDNVSSTPRLEHQVVHHYPDVYDNRYELKDVDVIKIHFLLYGYRRLSTGWKDKAASLEISLVEAPDERVTLCPASQPAVARVRDWRDGGGTRDEEPDGPRPDAAVTVRCQEHSNKTNVRHGVVWNSDPRRVPPALGDLAPKGLSVYGVVQRVLKPNRQVGANHRDKSTVTDKFERARHVLWRQRGFFFRERVPATRRLTWLRVARACLLAVAPS
jgi:hypothetical protein